MEPVIESDFEAEGRLEAEVGSDPTAMARTICLNLLTARPQSRSELARALQARGVPDDVAHGVLERFTELGLVDDASFAAEFVASRHSQRGFSAQEIARQLRDKGIDPGIAAEATSVIDSDAELEAARNLVVRKQKSMAALDPTVQTRRLMGLLARKGYSQSLAYRVIGEVLSESGISVGLDDTGSSLDP
jgi:regulatory protein